METVAVGIRELAPQTDRDLLTLLLTTSIGSSLLWVEVRDVIVRGINWMVDETGGDGGRNGTGGDGGNVDCRAVEFNLPSYERQSYPPPASCTTAVSTLTSHGYIADRRRLCDVAADCNVVNVICLSVINRIYNDMYC